MTLAMLETQQGNSRQPVSSGAEAASAAQQPYALQQAAKNFPVTIYTSKDCGDPCKRGLDYLKKACEMGLAAACQWYKETQAKGALTPGGN